MGDLAVPLSTRAGYDSRGALSLGEDAGVFVGDMKGWPPASGRWTQAGNRWMLDLFRQGRVFGEGT